MSFFDFLKRAQPVPGTGALTGVTAPPANSVVDPQPARTTGFVNVLPRAVNPLPTPQTNAPPAPPSLPTATAAIPARSKPMSFITAIEGDVHTFAAWAEKELSKLDTEAPAIERTVDTVVQYVGSVASILAGLEGGSTASAEVQSLVHTVVTGVTAVSGLVSDFGATPTVASVATALQTNAATLLAAAKVTNPTSVKAGTAIVNNLTALATALTAASTTPAA